MIVLSALFLFQVVLPFVTHVWPVRDDSNYAIATCCLFDKTPCMAVELNMIDAQLCCSEHPGDERGEDDGANKERSDLDAFGPLDNVDNCCVGEYERD